MDLGRRITSISLDYNSATYPYQDPEIAVLDVMVYRAQTKYDHAVLIYCETVYLDGEFTRIDSGEVLTKIAEAQAKPLDRDEEALLWLRYRISGNFKAFREDYIQERTKCKLLCYPSSRS